MIIVDYKSTTLRTNPSISVARKVSEQSTFDLADRTHTVQVLTILQQHYVETLGRAIVVNLPPLLNFFFKGISPFLDPVTRDKVGSGLLKGDQVTNISDPDALQSGPV